MGGAAVGTPERNQSQPLQLSLDSRNRKMQRGLKRLIFKILNGNNMKTLKQVNIVLFLLSLLLTLLTSPTSDDRSVCIVRSRTKATEFVCL
jgi:hypothetical protein